MPFARNGDCRIYWRQDGGANKPALLLLNSLGTDLSLWDGVVSALSGKLLVLRMDCRGHGASDAPLGPYTLEVLAADVLATMDAAGLASGFVCGISLGGMIAMTLSRQAPERLRGLVLACTSAKMDPAGWQQRHDTVLEGGTAAVAEMAMQRSFADSFRVRHPDIIDTVRAGFLGMSNVGYAGCCAAIRDMAVLNELPNIRLPTLVIAGSHDISTPFDEHGALIASTIPGARSIVLDTAHLACVEAPGAFAGALIEFIDGVAAGPARREAAETLYEAGLKTRREVLGDAWVDQALAGRTAFNSDFQALITRFAWHEVWGRAGLDRRTRRLLVLAITASLGRWEEFRLHLKAGLEQGGCTREEVKETLMQTAIYAGLPAANTAFAEAAEVMRALDGGET